VNLADEFLASASRYGDRPALWVDGVEYTYSQLAGTVRDIAAWLRTRNVGVGSRVGILASRSVQAYAGILAACWVGATYVPINIALPVEALRKLLKMIKPGALVIDKRGLDALAALEWDLSTVFPPANGAPSANGDGPDRSARRSLALQPLSPAEEPQSVAPDATAYIEFTSGSTGVPKGVMISVGALTHFLRIMQERYNLTPEDRLAATSDITFDMSFFDMFMAWKTGASLHVVPTTQRMAPAKFIREKEITAWFLGPAIATIMWRMNLLTPGAFPCLRYSLFASEPLPLNSALAWQQAAPNGTVENLFGPTEATVVCIAEPLGEHPNVTPGRDFIAIGRPLPGTEVAILDPELNILPPGQTGQIALSGVQLAQGYFEDPGTTRRNFPVIGGKRWYLTGDLGCQDSSGAFHFLGRIDNQVKVLGHRVELEEVETHLREVCKSDMVGAVAWPLDHGSAQGLVAFISGTDRSPSEVKQAMEARVLAHMVPKMVHVLPVLPLNTNGKVDRKALRRLLTDDPA
jgi:amino acid adenylation domain-containing protein